MRVLTLNLFGHHRNWERRMPVVVDAVRRANPDVVLFQEAVVDDGYDQAAEVLGGVYRLVHMRLRGADGSGTSIGSRWPIGPGRAIDLRGSSLETEFPAGALAVEVRWPGRVEPLLVVNHKPSWRPGAERERQAQAAVTALFIAETVGGTGRAVLLGGDLDAEPDSPSIRLLSDSSAGYEDLWRACNPGEPGATFAPSVNPLVQEMREEGDRRIDYLFAGGGPLGPAMVPRRCERVLTAPVDGVWGSDHFGLLAELDAPPEPARPLRA